MFYRAFVNSEKLYLRLNQSTYKIQPMLKAHTEDLLDKIPLNYYNENGIKFFFYPSYKHFNP